ncbi:MAG: hypothetical protein A2X49_15340 [Lentisphaerae bacterium GWF2_52_8]|nr:MAG: hypothetical protein A2X49_15340 [Lentisphaerae bacterium GWF2_52_8]
MWDVSFEGICLDGTVTFLAGSGVTVDNEGHVGKLSAAKTINVCSAEDVFYGVIGKVEEKAGVLALERRGMNPVPYTGTIAAGWKELVANGSGGVKPPATPGAGRMFHVVDVNATDGLLVLDLG